MRILLCDDDALFLCELEQYILAFFSERGLGLPDVLCYESGEALLSDSGDKNLVFLDVKMSGQNGISIGNELTKSSPNTIIIMITAFAEYLDDAMRFHVFRYLNKPLDQARLYRNLQDALTEYSLRASKTIIETKDGGISLYTTEIICIETQGRKTHVHTTQGSFDSIHGMKHWQTTLTQPCFIQCHRSYLINLSHVEGFTHDSIRLSNGHQAYLTRRKYASFKDTYMLFLESTR